MTLKEKLMALEETLPPNISPDLMPVVRVWFYSGVHAFVSEFVSSVQSVNGGQAVNMVRLTPLIEEAFTAYAEAFKEMGSPLPEETLTALRDRVKEKIQAPPVFVANVSKGNIH